MDIKTSGAFHQGIIEAVQNLKSRNDKIYLKKPWRGFYVAFKVEKEQEERVFEVFDCKDLGISGGSDKVYLVCENFMGQPDKK